MLKFLAKNFYSKEVLLGVELLRNIKKVYTQYILEYILRIYHFRKSQRIFRKIGSKKRGRLTHVHPHTGSIFQKLKNKNENYSYF